MRLAALLASLAIVGCATAPAIDASRLPEAPAQFKERARWTTAAPAEAQPRGEWWKAFGDPVLDDLVERAGRNNAGIQVAAARLAQARAIAGAVDSERAPQPGVQANASRVGGGVDAAAGSARGSLRRSPRRIRRGSRPRRRWIRHRRRAPRLRSQRR